MNHKHKWKVIAYDDEGHVFAFCLKLEDCEEEINCVEIEHRLNATECLSAKDAGLLFDMYRPSQFIDKLKAYARALEGK